MTHICTLSASEFPIRSVNVYQYGGVGVVRRFPIQLKKGQNRVEIKNLPSSILASSVKVFGFNEVVRLLDVVSTDGSRYNITSGSHTELLRVLEAKKHTLECKKWVASAEWSALYHYAHRLNGNNANREGFDLLDEFRTEGEASIERWEDLCEEIIQVEEQIREARRNATEGEVAVTLEADEGCTWELKIAYRVTLTSSWTPLYELHTSTSESGQPSTKVTLHYYACISQSTGEDWKDVSLKLSTNPDGLMAPDLSPTTIMPIAQMPGRHRKKYCPPPVSPSSRWMPYPTSTWGAVPVPPAIPPLPPLPTGAGSLNTALHAPVFMSPGPDSAWTAWPPAPTTPAPAFGTTAPALPAPATWAPVTTPRVPSPAPSLDAWSDIDFPAPAKEKQPEENQSKKQSPGQSRDVDQDKDIDTDTTKTKAVATVTTLPISPMSSALAMKSFTVDGKRTILTDGLQRQVALAVVPLEATLSYVVAPRSDRSVYLQYHVKNSSEYQLFEGPISVTLDDEAVSTAYIQDVEDDESFRCTLGVDPLIKVSYTQTTQTTQHTDVSSSKATTIKVFTSKITVHNKHMFAIPELIVRDYIPTAKDKRTRLTLQKPEGLNDVGVGQEVSTRVKLLHPDGNDKGNGSVIVPNASKQAKVMWTKPTYWKQQEKDGRFEWKLSLGRGEKVELEAQWELRVQSDVSWMESY